MGSNHGETIIVCFLITHVSALIKGSFRIRYLKRSGSQGNTINYFYVNTSWSKNLVKFSHKGQETFNKYLGKSKEALGKGEILRC